MTGAIFFQEMDVPSPFDYLPNNHCERIIWEMATVGQKSEGKGGGDDHHVLMFSIV